MKFTLLTVGRTDIKWVREGLEMYAGRIVHYAPFELRELPELKGVRSLDEMQIKRKEGEMILKALKPSDGLVLLDERGERFTSVQFSKYLGDRMSRDRKDVVFCIGGAYGFSQDVYDRAEGKISLGVMTFSHQLVRTIFAEQLYRAFTIMKGEPYHHE